MQKLKKIDVYIITGFLGSGKTTLLNNLLGQFSAEKNVVIENEFGKINIDATLINGAFDTVFELTNGCICCSINNQLLETLTLIHGLDNKPDNLFIETTGIADGGEIAANFTSPYIADAFDLKKIITVIDAENILFYKDSNIEVQKQIVAADTIIINKYHLISDEINLEINDFIKSVNPFATLILSKEGTLARNYLKDKNRQKTVTPVPLFKTESAHEIKTILYETEKYFDIQMLKYELFKNMYLYYHQIYRIKGYVLNAEKEVFLVQTTGKTVEITASEKQDISQSQLVFIGKELTLKTIERLLKGAIIKK